MYPVIFLSTRYCVSRTLRSGFEGGNAGTQQIEHEAEQEGKAEGTPWKDHWENRTGIPLIKEIILVKVNEEAWEEYNEPHAKQ